MGRVRETRRSTQGVTLEDLKSAEQLVKKKQQQENATRTTELQQLASASPPTSPPTATPSPASTHPSTSTTTGHSTATTTVTTSATLNLQVGPATSGGRVEEQDRAHERRPSWRLRIESGDNKSRNGASPTHDTHETSPLKSNLKTNGGGQVDYKKLWEESQEENSRLRSEMEATRLDLDSTRQQLDSAIQVLAKNSVSDIEKREKKVLEKKLGEMEDELKQLQKLKSENEKLKSENRALTRVVSKLTSAASKAVPATPGPVNRK